MDDNVAQPLTDLAEAGAEALVSVMATNAWESAGARIAAVIGMERRMNADDERLGNLPENERAEERAALTSVWRVRLADLLEDHPELADQLRAALTHDQPAKPTATHPSRANIVLQITFIPAAITTAVVAFLPWYMFESAEAHQGNVLVAVAAIASLVAGLWSLMTRPTGVRSPWLDGFAAAAAFVALFLSVQYLGDNSGDIFVRELIPSGLQEGTVYAAIAGSAVMTLASLVRLRQAWEIRFGDNGTSSGRLPSVIPFLLTLAVLLEIVSMVAPFDAVMSTYRGLRTETVFGTEIGWLVGVDTAIAVALAVAANFGAAAWVRRLAWLVALPTAAILVLAALSSYEQLTSPFRVYTLGAAAMTAAAAIRVVGLALLFAHAWRTRNPQP
ncbi:hypothetical protein [Lentzea sp. CA-135723]|uniref:hypothetical protein n=1 Tax=Lentzea sp. CA-135723 TaxID=3239950 RepID=UPI003D8B76CC